MPWRLAEGFATATIRQVIRRTTMKKIHATFGAVAILVLGGCTSIPTGPSKLALPGTGKTFEQFRFDDAECQRYAFQQIGGTTAEKAASDATVRSAALGTAVGAVAGAAIGGKSGAGVGGAPVCCSAQSPVRKRDNARLWHTAPYEMRISSACTRAGHKFRYLPTWRERCNRRPRPIRRRRRRAAGPFPRRRPAIRHRLRRAIDPRSAECAPGRPFRRPRASCVSEHPLQYGLSLFGP
jgi:hypothetical protein